MLYADRANHIDSMSKDFVKTVNSMYNGDRFNNLLDDDAQIIDLRTSAPV